jgi:hypothetical protein
MGLKRTTKCLGYEQITVLSGVAALTVPTDPLSGQKATYAIIVPEAQAVRWRDDGGTLSATVGMPVVAGGELDYDGDLTKIRFIEQAASAKLNVSYYL